MDERRFSSPEASRGLVGSPAGERLGLQLGLGAHFTQAILLVTFACTLLLVGCKQTEVVTRVVDGDTVVLASGKKVLYIGMDTPETVHPRKGVQFMGKEASALNRFLVEGKRVRLEFDVDPVDQYGRTLAYVYVGRTFVNAELVRLGYAQVMTVPPNVKYVEVFTAMQKEAREAKRGLWDPDAAARWNGEVDGGSEGPLGARR